MSVAYVLRIDVLVDLERNVRPKKLSAMALQLDSYHRTMPTDYLS